MKRDWQLGQAGGMWLVWEKGEPGSPFDRVARVPGGYWMTTVDGALLEYWAPVYRAEVAEDGTVSVGEKLGGGEWDIHTGPGTATGRKMTVRSEWRKGLGWYVN